MKKLIGFCLVVSIVFYFSIVAGCKKSPTEPPHNSIFDSLEVGEKKPNIYIYPTTPCLLTIRLLFPLGGSILESEPAYMSEWRVEVDPSGKINRQYDYLYYESRTPDAFQYNSGWVVGRDTLLSFFNSNLRESGFSERERADFTDYWIPRLIDHPYYLIYPQFSGDIEKVIKLEISKTPENILRLFYVIKGSESNAVRLRTPSIPVFERKGFVVTEWGVVLK